ncbi:MAG: hypothetical protein ACRD26_05325 [Vicinamibacterales bacterium]
MINRRHRLRGVLVAAAFVLAVPPALAQEPKSAALATELAKLLDEMKVDSLAARHPGAPDQYVGALYFPGTQLLVVTARYQVPELLDTKLASKAYRDVYIDLNSASVANTKVFVSDLGCNGLKARRNDDEPYDAIEMGGKNWNFDGDWRKAKLSEDEYMKAYQQAEREYLKMLEALLAELKKTS